MRAAALSAGLKRGLRRGADRAARWCGLLAHRERELARGVTVLMYHRVLPDERCAGQPFPSLVVPLSAFREQVRWLVAHGEVLTLGEALARDGAGERPRFVLTFDDGYADGTSAARVLEEAGARGTFFVTTGFVAGRGLLWFDRAALLFAALDQVVRLRLVQRFHPSREAEALARASADAARWTALLKRWLPEEREALLAAVERAAGGAPSPAGFEPLAIDELLDLRRRGHEIGSHTVTHALLPALGERRLRAELEDAQRALARWLGRPAPGFCYPNGDHDERTTAAVARAGHAYACITRDGVHAHGGDPLRIPRVDVVAQRVTDASGRHDPTAFRRELCGLYRRRGHASGAPNGR